MAARPSEHLRAKDDAARTRKKILSKSAAKIDDEVRIIGVSLLTKDNICSKKERNSGREA
jgi:hypothetical protein